MKAALSSGKHQCVKRAGIFLLVIALVAGMAGVSCGTSGYSLTMAADPALGGTATDETQGSPYAAGTIVSIEAEARTGYQFVSWTALAGTFGNANAASTIFAMPAEDVTVTASFAAVYDLRIAANPAEGGTATDLFDASPYAAGTVVSIQAVAAPGYHFVNWTGDVDAIDDVKDAETTIVMDGDYHIVANFQELQVGVKAGDWIKLEYADIGDWPAGDPYTEWFTLEFISVEGTVATVLMTMHMSDGTEESDTMPVDIAGSEASENAGLVIAANLTTGDSVYMAGYGDMTIEGETTSAYAGANRTTVYAGFSLYGTQVTYYWDKLTGVLVELSATDGSGSTVLVLKATETNMWGL